MGRLEKYYVCGSRAMSLIYAYLIYSWHKSLEFNSEFHVISNDISKASEKARHLALFNKLLSCGLPPHLCL